MVKPVHTGLGRVWYGWIPFSTSTTLISVCTSDILSNILWRKIHITCVSPSPSPLPIFFSSSCSFSPRSKQVEPGLTFTFTGPFFVGCFSSAEGKEEIDGWSQVDESGLCVSSCNQYRKCIAYLVKIFLLTLRGIPEVFFLNWYRSALSARWKRTLLNGKVKGMRQLRRKWSQVQFSLLRSMRKDCLLTALLSFFRQIMFSISRNPK